MIRIVLIEAGPTPWDAEDRIVGNQSLPLTAAGAAVIESAVNQLTEHPIGAVYRCATNESTDQVARLVAKKFDLRARDNRDLDEINLGLWQGLTREQARFRFPTAFEQWEENPASVRPPEGETVEEATARLRAALRKILRRNDGRTLAIALRPTALQIALGLLRREDLPAISSHLHNHEGIATIELADGREALS